MAQTELNRAGERSPFVPIDLNDRTMTLRLDCNEAARNPAGRGCAPSERT